MSALAGRAARNGDKAQARQPKRSRRIRPRRLARTTRSQSARAALRSGSRASAARRQSAGNQSQPVHKMPKIPGVAGDSTQRRFEQALPARAATAKHTELTPAASPRQHPTTRPSRRSRVPSPPPRAPVGVKLATRDRADLRRWLAASATSKPWTSGSCTSSTTTSRRARRLTPKRRPPPRRVVPPPRAAPHQGLRTARDRRRRRVRPTPRSSQTAAPQAPSPPAPTPARDNHLAGREQELPARLFRRLSEASTVEAQVKGAKEMNGYRVAFKFAALVALIACGAAAARGGRDGKIVFPTLFFDLGRQWGALYTVNPDGSGPRQITDPPRGIVETEGSVAGHPERIAFEYDQGSKSRGLRRQCRSGKDPKPLAAMQRALAACVVTGRFVGDRGGGLDRQHKRHRPRAVDPTRRSGNPGMDDGRQTGHPTEQRSPSFATCAPHRAAEPRSSSSALTAAANGS